MHRLAPVFAVLAIPFLLGAAPAPDVTRTAVPASPQGAAGRLDTLYARLRAAGSDEEANGIVGAIERAQLQSGSDTTDLLMQRALTAVSAGRTALAVRLLSAVIKLRPSYTEAWNKRATVYYLRDDYVDSMADIAQTLQRDPRHLGAWMGLGLILQQSGDKKRAYAAYQHVLEVNPHAAMARKAVDALRDDVEGRPI